MSGGPSSSQAESSKVTVSVDEADKTFSAILLRDLCECPACVHESTRQRLYSTTDIPRNIQARTATLNNSDGVDILWDLDVPGFDAGHKTTISCGVLQAISKTGTISSQLQTQLSLPISWDAKTSNVLDVDYECYMQDYGTLHSVMKQLQTHGLAFVTNSPGIEKTVSTIAERIGPVKDTFYGYTWDGTPHKNASKGNVY